MQDFFGFLMIGAFLLFIVGLVKPALVIRWGIEEKRGRKKVAVTYLSLFLFSMVMVGVFAPKTNKTEVVKQENQQAQTQSTKPSTPTPEETKKLQQEAFLSWYAGLDVQLKNFDNASKVWQNTFNALGNGSISRHQAYGQLKPMENTMSNFQSIFNKMQPPMALSKEHQKLLQDATQELSTMAYCRKNAVEKALIFLDDMKPSSMQDAKEEAQSASTFMISGIAKITAVRAELGLIENKQ